MMLSLAVLVLSLVLFFAWRQIVLKVETRRFQPERQDLSMEEGRYTLDEFQDMMAMLAEINRADWSGGYTATLAQFEKLRVDLAQHGENISSILEIGFGRGDFSVLLAQHFPQASVLGIDVHELSVKTAQAHVAFLQQHDPSTSLDNVRFELRAAVELNEPPDSFDVITTTLVNHHIFPDAAFVDFLRRARVSGRRALIFNDLYRSPVCYFKTVALSESLRLVGGQPFLLLLDVARLALSWADNLTLALSEQRRDGWLPSSGLAYLSQQVAKLQRYLTIFATDRPGTSLTLDGGVASVERAFSLEELQSLFIQAGWREGLDLRTACSFSGDAALSLDPCRMACVIDLRAEA